MRAGVSLHNAAGVHDASTAELAVGLAIARLRRLDEFAVAQARGAWLHDFTPALADRTVLILGYGNIGQAVERRLAGFEVNIIRVATTARTDDEGREIHGQDELPALLPIADVVIVIMPQTPATTKLINADFLARMKDGAVLVNVARGAIVDTDALLAEVTTGRISAALDVTDPEPLPSDHPLWTAPGVLISPHVGGSTSAFAPRAPAWRSRRMSLSASPARPRRTISKPALSAMRSRSTTLSSSATHRARTRRRQLWKTRFPKR
jgi:phosphoglycerate dehydrogenase-like enzyme